MASARAGVEALSGIVAAYRARASPTVTDARKKLPAVLEKLAAIFRTTLTGDTLHKTQHRKLERQVRLHRTVCS